MIVTWECSAGVSAHTGASENAAARTVALLEIVLSLLRQPSHHLRGSVWKPS